jgi:hypothetical protein
MSVLLWELHVSALVWGLYVSFCDVGTDGDAGPGVGYQGGGLQLNNRNIDDEQYVVEAGDFIYGGPI